MNLFECKPVPTGLALVVPVVFAVEARNADDQIAENLMRKNLSPLELAQFIRREWMPVNPTPKSAASRAWTDPTRSS
ncbi:MAG: hypothetical protein R3E99_00605 [Burkholderiaceae bacterium]